MGKRRVKWLYFVIILILLISNQIKKNMKKLLLISLLATSFLSKAQIAPYCVNTYTGGVEPITSVIFAGINNTSSPVIAAGTSALAHEDYTTIIGNVIAGNTYPITLKGNSDGSTYNNNYSVFCDWNRDNDFVDAGETFNVGSIFGSTGIDALQLTGSIQIPGNVTAGDVRMRVLKYYNSSTTIFDLPCRTGLGFGQSEDYKLVVSVPSCIAPANGTAVVNSPIQATLSWVSTNANFEILVQLASAVAPSPTAPDGAGINVASVSYVATLPTANSNYSFYVRSECVLGSGFSGWSGPNNFNNVPPLECAIFTAPIDAATNVPVILINSAATPSARYTAVSHAWTAPSTPVAGYRIYYGQTLATISVLNPIPAAPYPFLTVDIFDILYNTTYYWKAVPVAADGVQATSCPTFSFTTGPSPGYCMNGLLSPAVTYTPAVCDGIAENVITTTAVPAGTYSNVIVVAGQNYRFKSSVTTDFISLSSDAGSTAAGFGASPYIWTAATSGVVRVYTHLTNQCTASASTATRTMTVACGASLATESFSSEIFAVTPNPANDIIKISNSENININEIIIVDLNGRVVKTASFKSVSNIEMNIADLVAGMYLMNIKSDNGVATKKIIKN